MTDHDPLCPEFVHVPYSGTAYNCLCEHNDRVRAEADRITAVAEASHRSNQALVRDLDAARAERDAAIGELADIANRTYGAEGIHQRNYLAERDLHRARAEVAALRHDLRVERRINDEFFQWKAGLRAEVETLPVVLVDLDPDPHGKPIVRQAVVLADVLALIDGGGTDA